MTTFAIIQHARLQQIIVTDEDLRAHVHPDIAIVDVTGVAPAPAEGWIWDGNAFHAPPPPPDVPLADLQAGLCSALDLAAEAQRLRYITGGAGKAIVYLQKQTQAAQALAAASASPPMTAEQGAASFALLACEVGLTLDPQTGAAAVDVFGVARAVAAKVAEWLPLAARIETCVAVGRKAVMAATTSDEARAAYAAVSWPVA